MERLEENYQDRDMIRCDDGNKVYLIPWILGNMTMNSHHRSLKALDFTDIFAIYT